MNPQIRRLFLLSFSMVISLLLASTYLQFWVAPELNADGRNTRAFLHAAEQDRGPIIVGGEAIAESVQVPDSRRFERNYPQGRLYATVTGWFSASLNSATRLESASSQVLTGESPSLWTQRIGNLLTGKQRQGGGIELTLVPAVQEAAAQALLGQKGAVVALNPKTGEILALYSSPTYDPNSLSMLDAEVALQNAKHLENDPDRPLNNRALDGGSYAPGSVFKIVTTAAMLENGVKPDTRLNGPADIQLPGSTTRVPNFSGTVCGAGNPTLAEAFAISCNTPFIDQTLQMQPDQLQDKAKAFGFGQSFDIPLFASESNFPATADPAQLGLASIGQGQVTASPLQMAMVGAAVANDGVLMKPYLIRSILSADLVPVEQTSPEVFSNPISAETASALKGLMINTVNQPFGTGNGLSLPNVQVAAKTGTAETGVEGFSNGWITAFAPADNPQIVVAVLVEGDTEKPIRYGSVDGAPIARRVIEAALAGGQK
ncbi:penicillin-binding protein, transpeptidase domain protein [Gleimia coleocanis DSM 15436]|uniref:Penicillin-binding protein, transpeptidase domain protein n=1 Tax=Gleimia coleocanis DSM 15436 TaxID=525245 RepID=C0VY22_9ACTO|nr:penicillin-binding transpeptidase domain-containing protein [Gleimia coleocanis]EEH64325.1 penicillin-binding protein, transpeptidase domain protein [Gleimia coleocanis DSM 15436]